jgi:uncharacterized protein (TIGR03435 family)
MLRVAAPFAVSAIALLALGGIAAQTPVPDVKVDVASIRRNLQAEADRQALPPNFPATPGRAQTLPGGVLRARGLSVRELIRDAYGYRNRAHSEVVGAPAWIDNERYDVEARASYDFPASTSLGLPPAGEAALRALLAERFKLKVHVESQVRPVYEMVLHRADGKLGPNLKPSAGGCRPFFQREAVNVGLVILEPKEGEPKPLPPCGLSVAPMLIATTNMTMTDWARIMGLRPQLNRTVLDRTGLTGSYDILLQYPQDAVLATALPAIRPLLEDQLGLTLRDSQAPVEILVVESIDHPTEN